MKKTRIILGSTKNPRINNLKNLIINDIERQIRIGVEIADEEARESTKKIAIKAPLCIQEKVFLSR
jgi:hypothetical protein